MRLAGMQPDPSALGVWSVYITDGTTRRTVLAEEGYEVASQLTDALNARFGICGPLSAIGRGIVGEVAEMAENIFNTLEETNG